MFNDIKRLGIGTPKIWAWNLFWWKIEGCELLNGINVYPPKDTNSAGFVIMGFRLVFRVRYSKRTKLWHVGAYRV